MTTPSPAGRFRHCGTIIKRSEVRGGDFNASTVTERPTQRIWMELTPITAKERAADGAMSHEITHKARMRFCDLEAEDVIEHRGRRYEVDNVVDINNDQVEILAQVIERTA